jgi:uncharacterized protein YndB with AHSA1/START domain
VNATLHTIDGRSLLRFERRLAHPVEKVWRAITDPDQMAHWFPAAVEMDFRLGGRIRFVFPGGQMEPTDGTITELDPPRVFAFTWNGDPLRLELRPDGDGSLLIFTHAFDDRPMSGSFATGWDTCLGALEKVVAGPDGQASIVPERYAERHDAYAEAFGLTEGTVRDDTGEPAVRFERLLPHPVEQVWPAGTLTEVEPHQILEYTWPTGGRVRWELTGGHPAGTRVVLTQTLPAGDPVTALAAWHTRLDLLAGRLRGLAENPRPEDRATELTKRYTELVEAR